MSEAAAKMPYRLLGNTGLAVSVLSYGTWATYGAKDELMGKQGVDVCKQCFRVARNAGVNLFDNAETLLTEIDRRLSFERVMARCARQIGPDGETPT